jgi:hypothetical protein
LNTTFDCNSDKSDPSITEELVEAFEALPSVAAMVKKEKLKKTENETTKQVVIRAVGKLSAEKLVANTAGELSPEDRLQKSLSENTELKSQVANLQGQKKNILNQLNSQGKGADFPPCWVDGNGKAEFIYNINLSNDGIEIIDNIIPHRKDEQSKLPINSLVYGKSITQSQFLSQTRDLKQWAVSHQCHFYIRLSDETGGDKKNLYKALRRTVEDSFYIKLVRD